MIWHSNKQTNRHTETYINLFCCPFVSNKKIHNQEGSLSIRIWKLAKKLIWFGKYSGTPPLKTEKSAIFFCTNGQGIGYHKRKLKGSESLVLSDMAMQRSPINNDTFNRFV